MKIKIAILSLLLFIIFGCGGGSKSGVVNDAFISVDVAKNYPQKELILQDFMDVEYVALETNDDFLCQGVVLAIGKDFIIVKNNINDGDIFIFDRTGKGLRKFNHMGQGPEEYTSLAWVVLDEDNNELFLNDVNRVLVYDLFGKFKRSFRHNEGSSYANMYNFDRENLMCQDISYDYDEGATGKPPYVIISKLDGSVIKDISIPFQQKKPSMKSINQNGETRYISLSSFTLASVIPYYDSWIITVYTTDTVFRYFPDHSMTPFIVRTPSIQSDNFKALLSPGILTERYFFLHSSNIEPETQGPPSFSTVFLKTYLMYDRQENAIYEYTVYNDDYSDKISVSMSQRTINNAIAFWQKIEAHELVEAQEKGKLKGKLKEISVGLEEESNPVIMLVKNKANKQN